MEILYLWAESKRSALLIRAARQCGLWIAASGSLIFWGTEMAFLTEKVDESGVFRAGKKILFGHGLSLIHVKMGYPLTLSGEIQ